MKALLLVLISALALRSEGVFAFPIPPDRPTGAESGPVAEPARGPRWPLGPPNPGFASQGDGLKVTQQGASLYEALQSPPAFANQGGQGFAYGSGVGSLGERAPAAGQGLSTGPAPSKRYRFRGDRPASEDDPQVDGDYHFRPLTSQERQRNQPASVWRPLGESARGTSPFPLPGSTPPGWDHGPPPGPPPGPPLGPAGAPDLVEHIDKPGLSGQESESWFDRYYGRGRR